MRVSESTLIEAAARQSLARTTCILERLLAREADARASGADARATDLAAAVDRAQTRVAQDRAAVQRWTGRARRERARGS